MKLPSLRLSLVLAVVFALFLLVTQILTVPWPAYLRLVTPIVINGNKTEVLRQLLVSTPSCNIPYYDPFDSSIQHFIKPFKQIKCSKIKPFTNLQRIPDTEDSYELQVQEELISTYVPSGHNYSCCYANIKRSTVSSGQKFGKFADDMITISKCETFTIKVKLKPEEEFILVKCNSSKLGGNEESKNVYKNMHAAVPIKSKLRDKIRKRKSPDDDEKLSVLIVSYDAMSQLNLLRTMPKTVDTLKKLGFVNLRGYTKVGSNTFPNVFGLLTGLSLSQAKTQCWNYKNIKSDIDATLDDCPYIWGDFKKQGYVTGHFEDLLTMGARSHRTTFVKQPTDYFFRPYMVAAERYLPLKYMFTKHVCMGPTSCSDHIFNYVMEFLSTFRHYLHFSIAWLGNFSHNDINLPGAMDGRTREFLEELHAKGVYNDTMVLFISDHGMRYGDIRNTAQGWYEDRTPYLYVSVPDWFKKKYPKKFRNLKSNANKLASTYDLHSTLRDVLNIGHKFDNHNATFSLACPKCKSVISEDLGDRSCEDAGIPHEFCTCSQYEEMSINDEVVQEGARYAVSVIMRKLRNETKPQQCAELKLSRIVKANYKSNLIKNDMHEYMVTFETNPGSGLFQGVIGHEVRNNTFYTIGNIHRTNTFGKQGFCVDDERLKLYCYCP